jgi:hypothetical protein
MFAIKLDRIPQSIPHLLLCRYPHNIVVKMDNDVFAVHTRNGYFEPVGIFFLADVGIERMEKIVSKYIVDRSSKKMFASITEVLLQYVILFHQPFHKFLLSIIQSISQHFQILSSQPPNKKYANPFKIFNLSSCRPEHENFSADICRTMDNRLTCLRTSGRFA